MPIKLPPSLNGYWMKSARGDIAGKNFYVEGVFEFVEKIKIGSGWEIYQLTTKYPLIEDDTIRSFNNFKYYVYCFRNGPRLLFLSDFKEVSTHCKKRVVTRFGGLNFWPMRINIHALVQDIVNNPKDSKYLLTSAYAKLSSSNEIRSVSFFGENIGVASLFFDNLKLFNVHRCGLRDKHTKSQLITISNDGDITFNVKNTKVFGKIEKVLNYLASSKYLS